MDLVPQSARLSAVRYQSDWQAPFFAPGTSEPEAAPDFYPIKTRANCEGACGSLKKLAIARLR